MVHALIIDDNPNDIEVLRMLLHAQNALNTAIQNPTRLDDIRACVPQVDVIFLDLEMPRLSGYEVLRILKEEIDPAVPVVAYSVHANEIDVARDRGFHSFLGKPVDAAQFPARLARILGGTPVWEP